MRTNRTPTTTGPWQWLVTRHINEMIRFMQIAGFLASAI